MCCKFNIKNLINFVYYHNPSPFMQFACNHASLKNNFINTIFPQNLINCLFKLFLNRYLNNDFLNDF